MFYMGLMWAMFVFLFVCLFVVLIFLFLFSGKVRGAI